MTAPRPSTAMDTHVYNAKQLDAYLEHVPQGSFNRNDLSLKTLTTLIRHQLLTVPFETLALHYSVDKTISLDPNALFDKFVTRRRGGYCLENNTFSGCVLRGLGFSVYGVICRISKATWGVHDGSWRPMSHMANIVTIDEQKYLVDVGYGVDGPTIPIPLDSGSSYPGLPGQQIKLELQNLPQHTDLSQKVWVYSQRRGAGPWKDVYHFPDTETLPLDFDVLNFYNMTNSLWARTVVSQRFLANDDGNIEKTLLLVRGELKIGDGTSAEQSVLETYKTEVQRLGAFREHFGITLSEEEQCAIIGRPTALNKSE